MKQNTEIAIKKKAYMFKSMQYDHLTCMRKPESVKSNAAEPLLICLFGWTSLLEQSHLAHLAAVFFGSRFWQNVLYSACPAPWGVCQDNFTRHPLTHSVSWLLSCMAPSDQKRFQLILIMTFSIFYEWKPSMSWLFIQFQISFPDFQPSRGFIAHLSAFKKSYLHWELGLCKFWLY